MAPPRSTPPRAVLYPPVVGFARRRPGALRLWGTRLAAVLVAVAAAALLYVYVIEPVLPESSSGPTPIERPATIPARVPAWAWELHKWHLTPAAERGSRPAAAPRHVPEWFWDFRRWRLSLAPG